MDILLILMLGDRKEWSFIFPYSLLVTPKSQ